jgi:hypothetical protein
MPVEGRTKANRTEATVIQFTGGEPARINNYLGVFVAVVLDSSLGVGTCIIVHMPLLRMKVSLRIGCFDRLLISFETLTGNSFRTSRSSSATM